MADPKIPLADLPYGLPGAFDRVAGVDTATGAAKQFPMPQAGEPKDYQTRASLPSASGLPDGTAAHVNNDSNPDNNGRWAVFGGVWVQSADRVSGLEAKMPTALSVSDHAYKSAVLQSLGLGNKWTDFDFANVASYLMGGTYTRELSDSRAVLLMSTGARIKRIPADSLADVFSVSVTVLSKDAGSGVPRVVAYQTIGATEIPGTRRTLNLGNSAMTEPLVVSFEGIELDPTAEWLYVILDAGTGGNVRFTEPSVVDGPVAGFVTLPRTPPMRIDRFVDPKFSGVGVDPAQNAGTQVDADGYPALEMTGAGQAVRSYYVPAVGLIAPGASVRVMVEAFTNAASGAELTIIFRADGGSEISRSTLTASTADEWLALDANVTVPASTAQIQFRFVRWSAASLARFRKAWVFVSDPGGEVDESKIITSGDGAQGADSGVVYVDGSSGNDTNDGSQGEPFKTVSAAIAALGGTGSVIVQAGDIAPVNLSAAVNIHISADRDARVRIMGGTRINGGITKTAGQAKVYQVALAAAPAGSTANWVWHHEAPEAPIPADERHAVQNGRTHRLPSTRLQQVASVAEIDAASGPSWYWAGGTLYFSIAGGGDATGATLYVPGGSDGVSASVGAHVEISGIEAWYCGNGFNLAGCRSYRLRGCRAFGSRSNGFVRDGAFGEEVSCEAGGSGNDGFSTHNVTGLPSAARTHGLFIDQWSHDNGDDGCSEHERCDATYMGGLNEYNGDRGMATSYGANVRVHGMTSRKNGHADPTGGEGFGVVGVVNPADDAGVGSQMLCVGCVSDGDRYGFRAAGGNLIAQDCKTFSAVTAAYNALSGHRLELIDCRDSGSAAVKSGAGDIVVRNTSPVT